MLKNNSFSYSVISTNICVVFLILVLTGFGVQAQKLLYSVARDIDEKSLHAYAEIASVGSRQLKFRELLKSENELGFRPVNGENENIDFTSGHYWVRFKLKNEYTDTLFFFLNTARPVTDNVDLYQISGTDTVFKKSGDGIPFKEKDLAYPESVFKLKLNPRSVSQIYIHLKSDGEMIVLPIRLSNAETYLRETAKKEYFYGLFYGMLFLASIIYLFFYKSLKASVFLFYGLYILFFSLLQFSLDGYAHQYLFPDSGWFYSRLILLTGGLTTIFLGLYAEAFLDLKTQFRVIPKVFTFIYWMVGAFVVGLMFSDFILAISYPVVNALGLLVIFLIVGSVIRLNIKGVKVDYFFTLGISFLALGLIVFILNNFSLVPSNTLTRQSSKIGSSLEVLFLSLSMSNLIKKLKEEKEESQRLALIKSEEANELKLNFMSNISHELRTPLNAIMGISGRIVNDANLSDIEKKDVDVIHHSSQLLLNSINNILDFYKIEKKELELDFKPFYLQKTLEEAQEIWKAEIVTKSIQYKFEGLSENYRVIGDAARLFQVITDILGNAAKFTPEGEITFICATEEIKEGVIELSIKIQDTGVGISEEKMAVILKGFSQERTDDKRVHGGLGLGLTVARQLVKLHGGTLWLDSLKGKGTTCTIKIPYALAKPESKEVIKEKASPKGFDLKGGRVLVVEDNPLNQFIMKKMLSYWENTTMDVAENGEKALEVLKNGDYDLIFMDLQMPVMDGYETTEKIRSGEIGDTLQNIPIIALTADVTQKAQG